MFGLKDYDTKQCIVDRARVCDERMSKFNDAR